MNSNELVKFICNKNITLSEAMQHIDANASGIIFLISESKQLIACITDGDIRRYLLSGGEMKDDAIEAANMQPKYAKTINEAKSIYHNRNWIAIPIVDDAGHIVDIYSGDGNNVKKKQHRALKIPVVINAGGKGTRLDPLTKILPKPLIPVGELPIIELIMKEFQSYECMDFHVIVNYKKELIKAYFSDCEYNYRITWHDENTPLGTGGGLSLLRGKIKETFFFANCDVLITSNYESMIEFHKKNHNVITMICAYKNINIPYGVVEIGENALIKNMKEKPLISFLTNTGVYIVEPEVIDDMEDGENIGFPEIVERQRQKGRRVAVFPISENDWMDMGQISELEKMRVKLYGE